MRKYIFIVLALISFACTSFDTSNDGEQIKYHGNFFWEINHGRATVYLYGSIHIAKEDMYPLPDYVETGYKKSDSLVVEFDINNIDPGFMLMHGTLPDGQTLSDVIEPELFEQLKSRFDEYHLPETLYLKLKPWIAVMMAMNLDLLDGDFTEAEGIDMYFMNKADGKKGIVELESAAEQLRVFDVKLKDYQNEFVKFSLNENQSLDDDFDKLVEYWKAGNVKGLEKMIFDDYALSDFKPLKEALYTERNKLMADKIYRFFQTDKTYFVVVGAAHLIGEEGIVNLLESKLKK